MTKPDKELSIDLPACHISVLPPLGFHLPSFSKHLLLEILEPSLKGNTGSDVHVYSRVFEFNFVVVRFVFLGHDRRSLCLMTVPLTGDGWVSPDRD
jgi:hypothetical protein